MGKVGEKRGGIGGMGLRINDSGIFIKNLILK